MWRTALGLAEPPGRGPKQQALIFDDYAEATATVSQALARQRTHALQLRATEA